MTIRIRPRGVNFTAAGARLAELGITFGGYDHRENCYADLVIPPGVEADLLTDGRIEVERGAMPGLGKGARAWSSKGEPDPKSMGAQLRALRTSAQLSLEAASARTGGAVSPARISRAERTGVCDIRHLIALADLYGASLDAIAGRSVARGDRRR
jgi:hypothetical protein